MRRRKFITLIGTAALAWPRMAYGQPLRAGKIVRIGMLKTLGLEIPPTLIVRADEVIE